MAKGIGRLLQFGIAKETVRGTPEAAASFWIPWDELDVQEKDQRVLDEQSRGIIEDSIGQSIVKQWAEGKWKAPIGDKHFPLVLYSLFGSLSTADNPDSDPTVKDHTITVAQNAQHQALSLFIDDPLSAQDYKHGLGVIQSLEINYELGKFLTYTANVKSKKGATATLTPSATSENRFLPQHLTFKLATTYAGLTGASAISIKSLQLKIDQNIEDDDVLGNIAPADYLNKHFMIEGTMELLWTDETYKTIALSGATRAMRIDLINTDVVIGSAANPRIRIDLAKVLLNEIARVSSLNDLVKQTLSFKAHYSTSDSLMISALGTNTQASY